MEPRDKTNFLVEVTPEVYSEIKRCLLDEDTDSIVMHYSPYWKEFAQLAPNQPTKGEDNE